MNNLLSLLGKDSVKVAHLEGVYVAYSSSPSFGADVISAMRQLDPEVAWRAVWLMKRHARNRKLTEGELVRLAQCAEEMPHWAARLNLCQLFGTTGCPEPAHEALYPYLVDCFANRRPMIRAWAISVLVEFQAEEKYRKPVAAMLRAARAETAGSMRARLRHLAGAKPDRAARSE